MAFPSTPILDNFSTVGSTALTARAGWGAAAFGGGAYASYSTDATPTIATHTGAALGGNYWNSSSVDCECYCTVAAFDNVNDTFKIAARITVPGSSFTFYCIECDFSTTTDFQLVKYVAGARTAIASASQTVVANDGIGISVIGSQVTSYYRSGLAGAWVQKSTVSDSSITGSGFIGGFQHNFNFTSSVDDFGGGVPVPDGARPIQQLPFTRGAGGGGKL